MKIHNWDFPNNVEYFYQGKAIIHKNGSLEWNSVEYEDKGLFITEERIREKKYSEVITILQKFGKLVQ